MPSEALKIRLCVVASQQQRWVKRLESLGKIEILQVDAALRPNLRTKADLIVLIAGRKSAPTEIERFLQQNSARIFAASTPAFVDLIGECLEAGASGGATGGRGGDSPEDLLRALQETAYGGVGLTPTLADWAFRRLADLGRTHAKNTPHVPTPRERQIIRLAARGYTIAQIADHIGNSPSTVKNQLHEMYKILDVHHRDDAIEEARRRGWIQGDES